MTTGYSGTPLVKKLGIKSGFSMIAVNQPDYYYKILKDLPEDVHQLDIRSGKKADFIHLFVKEKKMLEKFFPKLKDKLVTNGMLWVSWPKKSSKVPTDVDESLVRKTGLDHGLVDTKICAVNEIWSGLKFVYRIKDR